MTETTNSVDHLPLAMTVGLMNLYWYAWMLKTAGVDQGLHISRPGIEVVRDAARISF